MSRLENGDLKTKFKKHHKGSPIRRIRFDKDGHMITIAKTVKIHDLEANKAVQSLKRNDGEKTTFYSVMPLGANILCAGDDAGKVFVWDTRSPDEPVFTSCDCEQYISDIDGKYEGRRMIVCTSGEGTLTAYDLRANKMIEPQSELFEAGFQCVKMVEANKKIVIGGEDGAIYVFNQGEWAHTSGKFAFNDDTQNRGKCSIEGLDVIPDSSTFLTASSNGRLQSVTLWPHKVLGERIVCKRNSLDTIHINPHEGQSEVVVGGDKYINILSYEEKSDNEEDSDNSQESDDSESDVNSSEGDDGETRKKTRDPSNPEENTSAKKLKPDTEDYLNIFQ